MLCIDGFDCSNSNSLPASCNVGSICLGPSNIDNPDAVISTCPRGTTSSLTGLKNETQCSSCDFALACGDSGGQISPGYFSRHSARGRQSDQAFCSPNLKNCEEKTQISHV